MIKPASIAALAVLLLAICAVGEARAGLMAANDLPCSSIEGMAAAPAENHQQPSESPGDTDSKLLANQPAHGAGATGPATSFSGGTAPAAVCTAAIFETTLQPLGFCVELENSQLPSPPASELLRPPRHSG